MPYNTPEKLKAYQQSERGRAAKKRTREKNKESISQYGKEYHKEYSQRPGVKEAARARAAAWRRANLKRARETVVACKIKRYKVDARYRLKESIRARLRNVIGGKAKNSSAVRDLGCTLEQFVQRLESKFQPGWTWENYGEAWVIDHIFPMAWVNVDDPIEARACCHYLNLQPLGKLENIQKGDSISAKAQYLFDHLKILVAKKDQRNH